MVGAGGIARAAALAACVLVRAAAAQDAEPKRTRTIEEIVVTAQKVEEDVVRVPISITVLDGERLRDAEIVRFHELAKYTPNVSLPNGTCCGPVFIRGIGTPFGFTAFDPTVGLVLDELPINQNVYFSEPLYDVERVEVLRGPQGTLFGRNATAGLFNVTTASPTEELDGYLFGHVGGLETRGLEGAIGGPVGSLGDIARFRLALLASDQAADVKNTFRGGAEPAVGQRAARLKLDLHPLPHLDVRLLAEHAETDADVDLYQLHMLSDSSVELLRRYDPRFEDDGFDHRHSSDHPSNMKRETDRLQGSVRFDAGKLGPLRDITIVAVGGATRFDSEVPSDFDYSPADILRSSADAEYDQRSAELRISTVFGLPFLPGDFELLAGGFLLRSSFASEFPTVLGEDAEEWFLSAPGFELVTGEPPPGGIGFGNLSAVAAALGLEVLGLPPVAAGDGLRLELDQKTTSKAFFGETAWRPSERWRVSAGARITDEEKKGRAKSDCFGLGLACAAVGGEEYTLPVRRRDVDVSPRFTAQFFPSATSALFVTRATGFKSGGFNNVSLVRDEIVVEPEQAVSWELGAKGTVFDGTLSLAGTLFHMDVDDLQVQNLVGPLVQVRNAASARSRGLELDARWLTPWEPLMLDAAAAFTDARFVDFPDAVAPQSSSARTRDLSGKRLPFVPEWQVNATPTLRVPLAAAHLPLVGRWLPHELAVTTALDVVYRSGLSPIAEVDPIVQEPSHVVLDGRIALATADGAWSLSLSATNLTDARIAEYMGNSVTFPAGYYVIERFQRNWSIGVRHAF